MKKTRLFTTVLGLAVLALLLAPSAEARPRLGSDRLCEKSLDANCQDYDVVCDGPSPWENCRKVGNGHWCAVFTTFPPDMTIPEHLGPVCRHETYGEPPVG